MSSLTEVISTVAEMATRADIEHAKGELTIAAITDLARAHHELGEQINLLVADASGGLYSSALLSAEMRLA